LKANFCPKDGVGFAHVGIVPLMGCRFQWSRCVDPKREAGGELLSKEEEKCLNPVLAQTVHSISYSRYFVVLSSGVSLPSARQERT